MKFFSSRLALTCCLLFTATSFAQVTIAPLTTFGGGDGWLAPLEGGQTFLTTGSTERGIAYSPTTNHLYLASRAVGNTVRILDAVTGLETGTLNTTGIAGGTFALNKIVTGADGVIYAANLRTGATLTQTYKVYRWLTEVDSPTAIFDFLPNGESRLGDDLDAIGSGAATRLATGYNVSGTATTVPGINSYAIIDPTASAATPTAPSYNNVIFPGTPPNTGDFRLGIAFLNAGSTGGTLVGTQGANLTAARLSDYTNADGSGDANGSISGSLTFQSTTERFLDYTTVAGVNLLATVDSATNAVRLYDMANPLVPAFLASANNTTAFVANANAAGDARFGAVNGNTVTLYAMNTNNGIQAFLVTVPEPSAAALLAFGAVTLLRRRR